MNGALAPMAQRLLNARQAFAEVLVELGGISPEQAERLMNLMLRHKVAKVDYQLGRINVSHGFYLDRYVIQQNALEADRQAAA